MAPTKEYHCIVCDETDSNKFEGSSYKSLCNKHIKIKKTPEMRKLILKPYDCRWCHNPDNSKYHIYCKSKCKKHYNRLKKKKRKIVVVNKNR